MTQITAENALQDLIQAYMQTNFETNPQVASYLGLHEYDGRVPEVSPAAITTYVARLKDFAARLAQLEANPADKEAEFDRRLLDQTLQQDLFRLEELRSWAINPMYYAELITVSPYINRNYAPLAERIESLITHLSKVPAVLAQGQQNLEAALARPALETAITMYEGMITYYQSDVTAEVARANDPVLSGRFEKSRDEAIGAISRFVEQLKARLPQAHFNFAIGAGNYRKMLATGEMVDWPVEQVLEVGQLDLAKNQQDLKTLCEQLKPGVPVTEVMREITGHHPTPETLVPDTIAKLEEVRQFLIDRQIVTVPSEVRCIVAETPPFMRFAFAFMDAPGPFEPVATEAYYYLTPVEPEWTDQQKEEWLTKFDYYTLQDVSIHEAYPGHYLQFLHTKLVTSRFRQMIWSYSFGEGWAHYTEQMMLEEGFEAAEPRYKIAQLAEALLRDSRYVASVMMHTQGMSVEEATRFIMENAYMEETPAASEARRGTFDPGYLNYTLGKLLLLKLREDYKAEQGPNFNLREFHDRVLAYGAPPVPLLRPLLLKNDNGQIL